MRGKTMRKPMRFRGKHAVVTTIGTAPAMVPIMRNKRLAATRRDLADRRSPRKCRPVRIVEFEPECDVECEGHGCPKAQPH